VPYDNPMFAVTDVVFEVRTAAAPAAALAAIRAAVKSAAPNLPPIDIQTLGAEVDRTLGPDLLLTKLSSFFGFVAAVLASIGIYGVMSYAVARRTREIGIRMALGAPPGNVRRLILGDSLKLVLIGIAVGVPAALGVEQTIASLLFGATPADPIVVTGAIGGMFAVAAAAVYLPARRATQVDPVIALRAE
jgi:ABC-type antimicrobial peptide transport system permease subunit